MRSASLLDRARRERALMAARALPRRGLGGAGLGNLYCAISDEDGAAAIEAALEHGFGLIDTRPKATGAAKRASDRR